MRVGLIILLLSLVCVSKVSAQRSKADSLFLNSEFKNIELIDTKSELDPNKSAMLSAVLPGLGQIYNNQFWKVPLVYGGGILIGHYINYNHKIYNEMRNALIAEVDNDPLTVNPYSNRFSETSLTRNRDYFRRNRDLLILIGSAFYLLNIVDAHVSAHLHEFEVNDNLSMTISPTIQSTPVISQVVGLSLSLRIK